METEASPYPLQTDGRAGAEARPRPVARQVAVGDSALLVLCFLWVAYTVVGVIAFFAILFKGYSGAVE